MPKTFGATKKGKLWGMLRRNADGWTKYELAVECELSSPSTAMNYIIDAAVNNYIERIDDLPYPRYRWYKNKAGEPWSDGKGKLWNPYNR